MTKKPRIVVKIENTEQDLAAFRTAMRGIKPISHSKIKMMAHPPVIKKNPSLKEKKSDESQYDIFSDYEKLESVGSEETICFSRPGLQHKILRHLRNGKYNIEATLDLHGMTVAEARQSLGEFLLICGKKGIRHILVIHGKGYNNKPILKNKVNHWLRQTEQVLAFSSALPRDGRQGAVYVLLKNLIEKGECD